MLWRILKLVTVELFVLLNTNNANAQSRSWKCIGANDTNFAGYKIGSVIDIAINDSGTPFVIGTAPHLAVKCYKNGLWQPYGGPIADTGNIINPSIAIDKKGIVYIAFGDGNNGNKATVIKYDSGKWVTIGNPGFSYGPVSHTSLAIDKYGNVFVYFSEVNIKNRGTVMKYNGSTWDTLGNRGITRRDYAISPIVLDTIGHPMLIDMGSKSYVIYYNDTNWVKYDTTPFINDSIYLGDIAVDKNNDLYVAFTDIYTSSYGYLLKHNSKYGWNFIGGNISKSTDILDIKIAISKSGIPYVGEISYTANYFNYYGTATFRYKDSIWSAVKNTYMVEPHYLKLITSEIDTMVYEISDEISVMKCIGDTAIYLEDKGISNSFSDPIGIQLDKNGRPMVIMEQQNYITGNNLRVETLINGKWVTNRTLKEPVEGLGWADACIDSSNNIYIINNYFNNIDFITNVSEYTNKKWKYLDTAGIKSYYNAGYGKIYKNKKGQLVAGYVYMSPLKDTGAVIIKKYDSTLGWQPWLTALIPNTSAITNNISFALDTSNNIYIAYVDSSANGYLSVERYDTLTKGWFYVGKKNFAFGDVNHDVYLYFSQNNIPLMAYTDNSCGGRLSVMYFNDSNWTYLGDSAISPSFPLSIYMVASIDTVYVAIYSWDGSCTYVYALGISPQLLGAKNIQDNISSNHLTIYPNPSDGAISYIYDSQSAIQNAVLELFNCTGNLVYSQNIKPNNMPYNGSINNLQLSAGLYLVRITDNSGTVSTKIIIQ